MNRAAPPGSAVETAEIVWDEHLGTPSVVIHRRGPDAQIEPVDSIAEAERLLSDRGFVRQTPADPSRAGDQWTRRADDAPGLSCIEES